jgi:hypothetical protein
MSYKKFLSAQAAQGKYRPNDNSKVAPAADQPTSLPDGKPYEVLAGSRTAYRRHPDRGNQIEKDFFSLGHLFDGTARPPNGRQSMTTCANKKTVIHSKPFGRSAARSRGTRRPK